MPLPTTTEYSYHREPDDDTIIIGCAACEYPAPTHPFKAKALEPDKVYYLCEFCAGSPAGNAAVYPEQYTRDESVLKAVNYSANLLLDRISQVLSMSPAERRHYRGR